MKKLVILGIIYYCDFILPAKAFACGENNVLCAARSNQESSSYISSVSLALANQKSANPPPGLAGERKDKFPLNSYIPPAHSKPRAKQASRSHLIPINFKKKPIVLSDASDSLDRKRAQSVKSSDKLNRIAAKKESDYFKSISLALANLASAKNPSRVAVNKSYLGTVEEINQNSIVETKKKHSEKQSNKTLNVIDADEKATAVGHLYDTSASYNPLYEGLISGNNLAAQALHKGDYKGAISLYQQALVVNPNDKDAAIGLMRAQILKGNYEYAKQSLSLYKNKFGEDEQFLIEQARLLILTNQLQKAYEAINGLLVKNPTNKLLISMQKYISTRLKASPIKNPEFTQISTQDEEAGSELDSGNYKKSLTMLLQSYSSDPNNRVALKYIIRAYLFSENYPEAAKYLAIYKNKFGADNNYLIEEARYYALTRNRTKALELLRPLLANDPTSTVLLKIQKYALQTPEATVANPLTSLSNQKAQQLAFLNKYSSNGRTQDLANLSPQALANLAAKKHDANLYFQAAKAYTQVDDKFKALAMIDEALKISNSDYLQLKAEIADDETAYLIYKEMYEANPNNAKIILALARKASATNRLDESSLYYSIYLKLHPEDKKALLEYAYIESWKGNDRRSVGLLNQYRTEFEISDDYLIERSRILASATRQTESLAIADALLPTHPNNYDLHYAKATALFYNHQPIEMFQSLDKVNQLQPGTEETLGLDAFLTTPYRNFVSADANYSYDSDTVVITKVPVTGKYFLSPVSAILLNFTPERLSARPSSGLNPINGDRSLMLYNYMLGMEQRFNPALGAIGMLGLAQPTQGKNTLIYEGDAFFMVNDITNLNFQFKRSYYDQSARAVSLGVLQNLNQVDILYQPCLLCYVNLRASYSNFSDTNKQTFGNLDVGTSVLATQYFNVRAGATAQWQSFAKQLTNGYYDPRAYQFYNLNSNVYYKYSDNIGYELGLGFGVQRDETLNNFRQANDFTLRAYYGIYEDWYLILTAAHSTRGRMIAANANNSSIYRVSAFQVQLTRRF